MSAALQRMSFPGAVLARGFWLYVWEIVAADGRAVLYVGMTGDTGSVKAQSPFNRLSQHLSFDANSNALRKYLVKAGINPEQCRSFTLTTYGPLFPEAATREEHDPVRAKVAALEKALRDQLVHAGYEVLNTVNSKQTLDPTLWQTVLDAFSPHFERLAVPGANNGVGER